MVPSPLYDINTEPRWLAEWGQDVLRLNFLPRSTGLPGTGWL
jgi:hypothetical protein